MLKKQIQDALNDQINAELYSGYLYQAMGSYFEHKGLDGFAQWMKAQAKEEQFHAEKFYNYVNERGGRVFFTAIDAPPSDWDSTLQVFEETLSHEEAVTERINNLVSLALEHKDQATYNMLQWFVEEQVEEEDNVNHVIDQLNLIGDEQKGGTGLLILDRELGQRVFAPPATAEE